MPGSSLANGAMTATKNVAAISQILVAGTERKDQVQVMGRLSRMGRCNVNWALLWVNGS
jgi:hypothetical protein